MCGENCKCKEKRNNIYISRCEACYTGYSIVAAKTADEANEYIKQFKERDKGNLGDSKGYSFVDEDDIVREVYTERSGIVLHGIHYNGWN